MVVIPEAVSTVCDGRRLSSSCETRTRDLYRSQAAASRIGRRIDPEHDLVIVMTRNRSGKNFSKYYPQFPRAVVAALK